MVGLEITFELGRYHATPWGAHVNDAAVEWPPSPWRLLRALYSASRTNTTLEGRREAADRALQALADAPPPMYELPRTGAGHTRHYMPKPSYSPVATGETTKVIDSYLAVATDAPLRVWWDARLDAEAADALAVSARSVGYLGRSESVCSIRFAAGVAPSDGPSAAPLEAEATTGKLDVVELLCPAPQQPLDTFAISVTELRSQRRLLPPGTRRVAYGVTREADRASPSTPEPGLQPPTLAMLRLRGAGRPGLTEAVAVGQALRRALQSRFGSHGGGVSPTFSGRRADRPRDDQHRHAHYLATPEADGPRIDRLYVWAPEGLGPGEVAALAGLSRISWPGIQDGLRCALTALGAEDALALPRLIGPERSWRSLTPFGLVRHPKQRAGELVDSAEDQVWRELAYRGFPEAAEVSLEKGSWHRFRSSKAGTSRLERASLVGVRISFRDPVRGPIALGALSHYGLGLMRPTD